MKFFFFFFIFGLLFEKNILKKYYLKTHSNKYLPQNCSHEEVRTYLTFCNQEKKFYCNKNTTLMLLNYLMRKIIKILKKNFQLKSSETFTFPIYSISSFFIFFLYSMGFIHNQYLAYKIYTIKKLYKKKANK